MAVESQKWLALWVRLTYYAPVKLLDRTLNHSPRTGRAADTLGVVHALASWRPRRCQPPAGNRGGRSRTESGHNSAAGRGVSSLRTQHTRGLVVWLTTSDQPRRYGGI